MANPQELYQAILEGDHKKSAEITREAVADAVRPLDLISQYMIPAMDEVGRRFQCEDYFVPELLLSARAMKSALELLRPLMAASGAQAAGKIVIGTVKGDLHDIGKNLVASMLEGAGFDVIDLGADVAPERFIEAVKSTGANMVCLSALLTVTMPSMKKTIDALNDAGVRDRVKVLVGGAPVTAQFARDIGADAYGEDSTVAVSLVRRFSGMTGSA
jgi:corrinoid protein of di/trimethylamine methyltransferase